MKWRFCVAKSTEIIHFSFFNIHYSLYFSPLSVAYRRHTCVPPPLSASLTAPHLMGSDSQGRGFSLDLRQRQPHPSTFGCHLLPLEKANLCVTFYSWTIKKWFFTLFKIVVRRLTSASLLLWEKVSALADGWVEFETNLTKASANIRNNQFTVGRGLAPAVFCAIN